MTHPLSKINRLNHKSYLFFNLIGLTITSLALNAIFSLPLPKELESAGHFQFLTNLSLIFTIITILSNIITVIYPNSLILGLNIYLNAITIILETLVALIYWILRIFFIYLIIPKGVKPENFIPLYIDMSIHLFPITFLSIDYYLIKFKNFNINSKIVFGLVIGLTSSYWILLESLIKPPASYPYPFLNVDTKERVIIFVIVGVFGFLFYQISNNLHKPIQSLIYGKQVEEKTKNN
ncbi:putative membrane protein [Wickerhamomyces ciferrii]|uniref:Membrane protein n=1 Tax=Wickerhamomyces ciferrii (strain ATCC 14091 / BCRC 22168 / CBS 111 / JCM 3599 / NBRC 0793 / NRRL Y-1031 F-60-10) TaxID=1206466 RepID=K0KLA7_WICCF|nr:uncharacterized protein BN7_2533 [Wickerhamomyces ciferrii]CCH42987.1 putative membrane protein [Wickerhamomyces ciferrii]